MKTRQLVTLLIATLVVACPPGTGQQVRLPDTSGSLKADGSAAGVLSPLTSELFLQPAEIIDASRVPSPAAEMSHSLESLVQLALANNPAIAQADARVRALRGQWVQVGLPPNPTAGYVASEIGNDGEAGQQGGYLGQELITGGKLHLNRAVLAQEIEQARYRLDAMRLRTETDVRRAYYRALIAQRRIALAEELLRVSSQAAEASFDLLQAEEIPRAGLLQTQVEQQNFAILLRTANHEMQAAWRQLSAVVGQHLVPCTLQGNLAQLPSIPEWQEQLDRIIAASPEVAAAVSAVARAQSALHRACAEPIPDIMTQVSVQYDDATNNTITGAQIGVPLPIWNRNQGGIEQAQAEVAQASRNVQRVQLDLQQRLAVAYQQYSNARAQADIYTTQILPKAQETYELVQRGYRLGEIGYLDLLTAQRLYSQTSLSYLDSLSSLWSSWSEIDGLLLTDSLSMASQ